MARCVRGRQRWALLCKPAHRGVPLLTGRKTRAVVQVRLLGPEDTPFLPGEGELYWVQTIILWSGDRKPTRPVVVIEAPMTSLGRIQVVTRTTDVSRRGVRHEAMPEAGLTKCGVFADLGSTEATLWTPRNARKLGSLPPSVFCKVQEWFG
jgi:hypothetical protein